VFYTLTLIVLGFFFNAENNRISGDRFRAKFWLFLGMSGTGLLTVWHYYNPRACWEPGLPNPIEWVLVQILSFAGLYR
jgi:hypothetical protein